MNPHDQLQPLVTGQPTSARISDIEAELGRLWRSVAGEGEQASLRASTLSLMVYVPDGELLNRASDAITRLTGQHPSRTIVMVAEPDAAQDGLEAQVTAYCQIPSAGNMQICAEQILITARGTAVDGLHGTAVPLLLPDLPVFLWWLGDPPLDGHLFAALIEVSDRLLVDSASFRTPVETLARLAGWMSARQLPGQPALGDLAWGRLTPWRHLVAQFFDAGNLQPYLPQLSEATIRFRAGPDDRANVAPALLFAGWLASRLGWSIPAGQASSDEILSDRFHTVLTGPQPVHLVLESQTSPGGVAGALVEVSLAAGAGTPPARFTVRQSEDGQHATSTVEIEGAKPVSRVVPVAPPGDTQLLSEELDILGRNPVYEAALLAASRLGEKR